MATGQGHRLAGPHRVLGCGSRGRHFGAGTAGSCALLLTVGGRSDLAVVGASTAVPFGSRRMCSSKIVRCRYIGVIACTPSPRPPTLTALHPLASPHQDADSFHRRVACGREADPDPAQEVRAWRQIWRKSSFLYQYQPPPGCRWPNPASKSSAAVCLLVVSDKTALTWNFRCC